MSDGDQMKITNEARERTVALGYAAPNPHQHLSMAYRFWADGIRMGLQELEELEGDDHAA